MKIAIMGDVHGHHENLSKCLESIRANECSQILHLGDYGGPKYSLKPIVELGIPLYGIRGNTDGEKWGVMRLFENNNHCDIARTNYSEIEFDGKKMFMTHFPMLVKHIELSGSFDLILYGHTHIREERKVGETLIVNPGSLAGDEQNPSYAIYNTTTHTVEFIELV